MLLTRLWFIRKGTSMRRKKLLITAYFADIKLAKVPFRPEYSGSGLPGACVG
jgi:hypothetical protein